VRLEGRMRKRRVGGDTVDELGGGVVEGTSKRILYLPPIPPYYTTQRFQSQTLHHHTTTPNLSTPLHQTPRPNLTFPLLIPKPVQKNNKFSAQNVLQTRRAYLWYRRFDCISPALLKICRSKSNEQKTVSQPIKTEALTICR